mgnify:FL=1
MSDIGARVVARRAELRLGQEELAELAGVSVRFVRDLELCKRSARFDKVVAVLDVLGLTIDVKVRGT